MREVYQQFSQLVIDIGKELGLSVKGQSVLSSSDRDTSQIAALIVDTCEELISRYPWRSSIGTNPPYMSGNGEPKYILELDDDIPLFDSRVLKSGAKWRYLNAKGLAYAEVFRTYETRINSFAFDRTKDKVVNENATSAS
jgi:hypothetical protein